MLHTFNEMVAKGSFAAGKATEGVLPTTATVLEIRSPVIGDAVEEAAKRDPRVFAICKLVYDSQIYVLFATTLGALLAAIAIDLHRLPAYVVEIDETRVVPNPLVNFVLPKEAMQVAVNVQRQYQRQRAEAASVPPSGPVQPPTWYGPDGRATNPVEPASGVAGQ